MRNRNERSFSASARGLRVCQEPSSGTAQGLSATVQDLAEDGTIADTVRQSAKPLGGNVMIRSALVLGVALLAASILLPQPVFSQEESDQRLGTVHFETSCNEVA